MTELTHASIVPLIGGETLGAQAAFGKRPEYLLSYTPFQANDSHLVNYYQGEVPYLLLDEGGRHPYDVDVVSAVCPCAGLSTMSAGYGDHNQNNKWMFETAKYVLGEMRPRVFWGENAPTLASKIGNNVRGTLKTIGAENGYKMSVYRTKTILHGGPQVRERSFYFFWRGDRVPLLNYFNRPHEKIEDVIMGATSNFQTEVTNPKIPSRDDPYYRYLLEVVHGGLTHRQFVDLLEVQSVRGNDVYSYIERAGHDYETVGRWMESQGLMAEVEKCRYRHEKLSRGGNIMRRGTVVPKDHIGAFVGHHPTRLTHPYEDRYINYREAMTIMGLPQDFELLDPKKNLNHVAQNVPVQTATDMANEVIAAIEDKRDWIEADYVLQNNYTRTHVAETRSSTLETFL